jgi:predicted tellurium resistance membrane protein TerC
MENLFTPESLIALVTLTFLEIILGIDNIIFISIITNKLPKHQQPKARLIGLSLAMIFRILLLMSIAFIVKLTDPIFTLPFIDFMDSVGIQHAQETAEISWRDVILFAGGLFLIAKSISELHGKVNKLDDKPKNIKATAFSSILIQIVLIDIVFSFDSILTAVGLSNQIPIMVTAIVISIIIMMLFSGPISAFVNKHITLQILALTFLVLIGFMLMIEAFAYHVPKGYIYFAMAFSVIVEVINMRVRNPSDAD